MDMHAAASLHAAAPPRRRVRWAGLAWTALLLLLLALLWRALRMHA